MKKNNDLFDIELQEVEGPYNEDRDFYQSKYTEKTFLEKVGSVFKSAGLSVIYVALLLYEILASKEVSIGDKGVIIGALGYFIFPVDLIPDMTPVLGYSDDLSILIASLKKVKNNVDDNVKEKALSKLKYIFKEVDEGELKVINKLLKSKKELGR